MPVLEWQGKTKGSTYSVKIAGANPDETRFAELRREVEDRLREINRQMSHYQPDSELSRFNRAPAKVPFKISAEFARVVRFSLELHRRSHGAFDPTLGPLINLWGFGEQGGPRAAPADNDLRAVLKRTGCRHLTITADDELVKDIPELALNLSAVAKGFGVDEIARVLRSHGFTNTYVSIAGEVLALGQNASGTNWQIGIAAPLPHWTENDPMAVVLSVSNRAISTSGDYQKFLIDEQGHRLCHILDPKTGRPVQHNLGSVSVVAPDSMTADGLATALFVLGPKGGLRLIESWPDTAALFIVRQTEGQFQQIPSRRFAALTQYQARSPE